ncbi:hypothetical protein [Salicibibacter kimchii]|nr:hypothetical protein [Salicibibacter kimchii]
MPEVVKCVECGEKMIEDDDTAMLKCQFCGNGTIEVIVKDD